MPTQYGYLLTEGGKFLTQEDDGFIIISSADVSLNAPRWFFVGISNRTFTPDEDNRVYTVGLDKRDQLPDEVDRVYKPGLDERDQVVE